MSFAIALACLSLIRLSTVPHSAYTTGHLHDLYKSANHAWEHKPIGAAQAVPFNHINHAITTTTYEVFLTSPPDLSSSTQQVVALDTPTANAIGNDADVTTNQHSTPSVGIATSQVDPVPNTVTTAAGPQTQNHDDNEDFVISCSDGQPYGLATGTKRFANVLLVVHFNFPHYQSIPALRYAYSQYFNSIVFTGPLPHEGVINCTMGEKGGVFGYVCLAEVLSRLSKFGDSFDGMPPPSFPLRTT